MFAVTHTSSFFMLACFFKISSGEHEHLNDLSQIRFLVIDEADRMVQQGSFKELGRILDAVQAANPMDDDDDDNDNAANDNGDDDADGNDAERMFGLPGVPGEARVEMLSDDVLKQLEQQRGEDDNDSDDDDEPSTKEMEDGEYEALANEQKGEDDNDSDADFSLPGLPPVERQTFVYSATLTLASPTPFIKSKAKSNKKRAGLDIDGAIAEILEKARSKGKTKIVDLTNVDKSAKGNATAGGGSKASDKKVATRQIRLPPGLELQAIKCTQLHKDSHLYAYIMTTTQGISGPCLVFCNSIAAVRRVGTTLETLGLPVRILHAQMQQVCAPMSSDNLQCGLLR
jgi:ATP-dependent RNA helicase DDX24/MAK5